ncbi:MAG: hypothetical protein ACRC9F_02525, partial [Metamycoplasmataceae bacterium]
MLEELREKLDFELLDCKFSRRDNLDFLDIKINYSTLAEIEEKSKIISNLLKEIDKSDKEYYLNIYSPGAERKILFQNLVHYINENINITLIHQRFNCNKFDGKLLEIEEKTIKMKVNIKGCIRKIDFELSNIKNINETIK